MHNNRKNAVIRGTPGRRGYAMLMVCVFVMLLLSLVGVGWRRMASAVRVASVRSTQSQRDEGSLNALGMAMHLLETGLPPASPYVCGTTITTSQGAKSYTVTFTSETSPNWSVSVRPTAVGETPTAMPTDFAPP
jgi:hypothetical protein